MCGIWGFSGNQPPDISRLKILGLYNQTRGLHSCGIYYSNEILKGVDDNKLFSAFIANNFIESVEGANVFIGHTRNATYGSHSEANAHPFLINDRMVLAHNG